VSTQENKNISFWTLLFLSFSSIKKTRINKFIFKKDFFSFSIQTQSEKGVCNQNRIKAKRYFSSICCSVYRCIKKGYCDFYLCPFVKSFIYIRESNFPPSIEKWHSEKWKIIRFAKELDKKLRSGEFPLELNCELEKFSS
jgi:hypothetical protein